MIQTSCAIPSIVDADTAMFLVFAKTADKQSGEPLASWADWWETWWHRFSPTEIVLARRGRLPDRQWEREMAQAKRTEKALFR